MDRERGRTLEPDTLFRIRSMAKPFVGTAALMLIEERRLGLDQPVAKLLPSFAHGTARQVTIRHLLTHTGGFDHPGFPDHIASYGSLQEAADAVGRAGPAVVPGTRFCYSDAGSSSLGAAVAAAGGQPVARQIERRILEPPGMTETRCGLRDAAPEENIQPPTGGWGKTQFDDVLICGRNLMFVISVFFWGGVRQNVLNLTQEGFAHSADPPLAMRSVRMSCVDVLIWCFCLGVFV